MSRTSDARPWTRGSGWGDFTVSTALPNVSGAAIQDDRLRVGDMACVDGVPYTCTASTPGAATWAQVGAVLTGVAGDFDVPGDLTVAGDVGFYGTAAAAQPAAYTPTNVTPDRAFDADTVAVDELADVVGTLIADLQSLGLLQ